MANVITLPLRHTNCYLLQTRFGYILIDTGWPDSMPDLMRLLGQHDIKNCDIRYLVVTHFHPDHAGLVQPIREWGTELLLHTVQAQFVQQFNEFFQKHPDKHYKPIRDGYTVVSSEQSRALFERMGFFGEILPTPGHSDDSVTLIADDFAFLGDLPDLPMLEAYNDKIMELSWDRILNFGVRKAFPSHGMPYEPVRSISLVE